MLRRIPGKSPLTLKAILKKGGPLETDKRSKNKRRRKSDRREERMAERGCFD